MCLLTQAFILLFGICVCEGGYGIPAASEQDALNDVEAPAYVPSYAKSQQFGGYSRNGYGGTKTGYTGTKTGYTGTKTAYTGTKTGYTGTKTGYTGTKTGYTGTKTGYAGTKTGYPGTKTGYSETRTWNSESGSAPTYEELQHNANQILSGPKCDPACKNNGICIDTNTCHCAANFQGKYCEFEKKPCLTYPPLPMNSGRKCNSELCTITCMAGHKFIDGTTVANMRCVDGQWQPTRGDFTSIPDCEPECNPPCVNGGVCLSVNTCQCPTEYRGPQCQYATSVCDFRKLAFNGNYKCKGNDEEFSCNLSCPPGATGSATFAEQYTCLYSTGTYTPQPIPHCVFNEVVVVTPSNYLSGYSSSYYETYYHNGSASHSQQQSGLGHGHRGDAESVEYGRHSAGVKGTNVHIVVQDFTPKAGTCLTWAGVHYKTFDGKIYSFESPCQHILVQDAKEHEFTVAVKQGSCERRDYCPLELTIYLGDKPYVLSAGEEEGSVVFRSSKRLLPIPATLPGLRVSSPADYVLVHLDALGLALKWDMNNVVIVEGTVLLWNNTQGLCGRLDGNPENDFTTKEGTIAKTKAVLASSWQLKKIGDVCDSSPSEPNACAAKSEEDRKKAQQFCTNVFVKDKFRKCSSVMDVTQLLDTCQWDYCACTAGLSPEECACETVAVYAKECQRLGVQEMKTWRDADTCPMKCTEGKLYKSCGPDVQASCQFPTPSAAEPAACREGCFCPEGLLLEAGKCVPQDKCPCRLRNKSFKPGSAVKKDCNTCTCQAGLWACTAAACGARCGAVGDPHYTTFDGLRYDFMGHCTYTLLHAQNVTVEVENVPCAGSISEEMNLTPLKGQGKPSCTKAVNLKYNGVELHLKQGGLVLVNGQEVATLPVHVGDVLIRAASSLFLIVQLPNGLDLWWDGNTRVFVDVPPTFQDKTKGLCGTFNLNQKDDFLTPEGDTEQTALAFANKWKTRELCSDVDVAEPEHPCKANIENKEAAEKYCSKLMSKLFEPCHWHVSVSPYYEECVYDMCACAGDAARCLCPILGDYAMTCAKSGVNIQWRYNVKECELSCSGGQEYTVCADSCQRTCSDVALSARAQCKPCCVEGCACPVGQVLNGENVCVPVGLCPCFHKGMQFDAGYKEVRAGRRERELCTCVGARWECSPATALDAQAFPPAEDLRSNCSAARHREFTTCERAEPLTCKNMHLPSSTTTKECRPGCQCKKGYVLDASSNKCVLATECPCHHGGRSFPDGHEMQEECNKCKCENGNWVCSELQCPGVCSAWGDSHVATFDGREYEFEGVCTYLLAKGSADATDGFEVQMQNAPCGTTGATCSKSVTLKVGNGQKEEIVELTKDAPLPDLSKLERIKLRIAGVYVFLDVPSLGMSLQWDRGVRVYVRVDPMWRNRVKGLCGNYNSDSRDDFQKPEGGIAESSVLIFADSWKLRPTCPKPTDVEDHCRQRPERKEWASSSCGALKRHPFTLCHSEVPPTAFLAACERDACACDRGGDCACVCTALAAYAHRCAERGVVFKWRTKDQCPIQCDETCASYEPCMSPCPQETCDNTYYYKEILPICQRDTCVEGCKPKDDKKQCPEGELVSNSTSPLCVPRARCKPLCMTLPDGTLVLEGEVLEQDACHTCRCSKKQRVCTGQPCSTQAPSFPPVVITTPHDEPMKCETGWTPWVNRGPPETTADGHSVDKEPLPKFNELQIGQPMCAKENMTRISCRTTVNHQAPKQTGLDVECSLEKGLVCNEIGNLCPDFEIQVFCDCDGEEEGRSLPTPPVFQCLNSSHPNYAHPTSCAQFYECTPDALNPRKPHSVLKACAPGLLYSKKLMVCDWPVNVMGERPECKETVATTPTVPPTSTTPASTTTVTAPGPCPPGQVYKDCAYPCDSLCDHFKVTVVKKGQCKFGDKCIEGCVDESVANIKCESSSRWRDEKTCVPLKDCTCYYEGQVVKPGGVAGSDCTKCQCLDNALHCDSSECVSVSVSVPRPGPPLLPMILPKPAPSPTSPPTTSTTVAPLIVTTTVSPPPDCSPDRYKNLLWSGEPLPASSFTASSVDNDHFKPQYAKLNGQANGDSAGSWNAAVQNTDQFIQVELPFAQPIYGAVLQGSPMFDQYVTSYELMYGDDGHVFSYVKGPKGDRQVFRGPVDNMGAVKQMFTPPIEAKFVRIKPLTWHDAIAVRFELVGCGELTTTTTTTPSSTTLEPLQCTEPLGLAADLPLESIEVSSNNEDRKYFALTEQKGWRPLYSTPGEWIMFDFTSPRNITGIKTKGGVNGWVTAYSVMYSSDLTTFNPVVDETGATTVFPANFDKDTVVTTEFRPPIHARYLKVLPAKWKDGVEMRVEPIGCFEPYPVPATTLAPLQCTEPLGLAADLPIDSVEVSSNNQDRKYFALTEERGWRPLHSTPGEWIMFDFTSPRDITGIKTKGGVTGWVTAYSVMYSSDLTTFNPVVDETGATTVFPANFDKDTVVTTEFRPPIHARYLKVLPAKWKDGVEMRVEPIGCFEPYPVPVTTLAPLQCTEPLGLAADLPIESIEVSSNNDDRQYFALAGQRGWRPLHSTPGEWIMFDFTSPRNITGIKTKGGVNGWVTAYSVMYSSDLTTFNPVVDETGATTVFPANFDKDTVVTTEFRPPIHARYLKVLPAKWKDGVEMRVEPIGCFEPYPTTPPKPTESPFVPTTSACALCPGVLVQAAACRCHSGSAKYFDGDGCVTRDQCPCVEGFMTYAVGSSFRGTSCDECVCKLGGVTDCKPVKDCKCAEDLVPKLSTNCECLCEACPAGTKICPTSRLCLAEARWCDGLQDCPDDERHCAAPAPTPTVVTTVEPPVVTTVVATVAAVQTTTAKPVECEEVKCPPGYLVRLVSTSRSYSATSDLPPPRPRVAYRRYQTGSATGGYSKGGFAKGGFSKGGFSKGGFSKGGTSQLSQSFTLDKATLATSAAAAREQPCQQFKCAPLLPPLRPGATRAPQVCSTPLCPPGYELRLEAVATGNECPQYGCAPPPERAVFCNVTGRTFNTFDGSEYKYDVCYHMLARETKFGDWTIILRKKCRVDGCLNHLLVSQDDQLILVKPSLMIEYDNFEYSVEQTNEICFQKNSFDISKMGSGLAIKSRKYNFVVLYNTDGDVKVGIYKSHHLYKVDGLCGYFDGLASNDRRLPDGGQAASVDQLGRAWAKPGLSPRACETKIIPPDTQKRVWNKCDVITKEPLSKCAKVLNLELWRGICLEKLCRCSELVVNGSRRSEEECRCLLAERLVAECLAADKDLDIAAWRINLNCPAECPPPLVHYDCYSKSCEPTCSTSSRRACAAQTGQCFPGCYCPEGTLRKGDTCVTPHDCLDCNCHGQGSPAQYTTFEGDEMPFFGNCTYLASRDRNETGQHKYEVYATNGPCAGRRGAGASCTRALHVLYQNHQVHVTKDPLTNKLVTSIGTSVVFKYPVKKDWVTIAMVNKQDVVVKLHDAFVELAVMSAKMEFFVRVPSHVYARATEGMCGACGGAGAQDMLLTSNGTLTGDVDLYGKSWQATPLALAALGMGMGMSPQEQAQCDQPPPAEPECAPPPADQNFCYNLLDKDKFGRCQALVDPQPFLEACEKDICANASDLCASLESYASACRRQGVCLDWRGSLCPHTCEAPFVYRACVACERSCDNHAELERDPNKCDNKPQEGCFCPEGKVRVENSCIEPTKCFPCDANKEHYAGDEWQEDACTKCTCSKVDGSRAAHVACTQQTCSVPVCAAGEDLLTTPRAQACCPEYLCVKRPQDNPVCHEPKKMECGYGQVLKQKTTPNGCKEFACECKPSNECEHIPTDSEVEIMPGMQRLIDTSGCCPRAQLTCRPDTCPAPAACPPHHTARAVHVAGTCCEQHKCELPADKCLVTLEWEAAPKGGEKPRSTPQTMLKDLDAAWLDGPCRACRCEPAPAPAGPAPRCAVTDCPPLSTGDQFVVEARPVPFSCCPVAAQVACRAGDTVYRVGETWTNPHNVCESYRCVEVAEGKLEKVTSVQTCPKDCEPGWKYFPASPSSQQCCGSCRPVACVCAGVPRPVGAAWQSPDRCTNYTCVLADGNLQVQTSNETCPEVPEALKKQFVLKEEKPAGKCCKIHEPVACRVGDDIYQEGQSWLSPDPCKNYMCARDGTGRLAHAPHVQACAPTCAPGWRYHPPAPAPPAPPACCGDCRQDQCVTEDGLKDAGSTWTSADNCTTYTCVRSGEDLLMTSSRVSCPDVTSCAAEDLVNETCCTVCQEKPQSLKTCYPEEVPAQATIGLVRVTLRPHGVCVNAAPVPGFRECRGSCRSGTLYNNQTGSHDSQCECCQATKYNKVTASLSCADGSSQPHVLASPLECGCRACGDTLSKSPTKTGYSGVKTGVKTQQKREDSDYDIPEIYARMAPEARR